MRIAEFIPESTVNYADGRTKQVMYVIVEEFAKGGELYQYVADSGYFTEPQARFFFHQIVEGLGFIHENGMAHRDMKLDNILLDENFIVKIADFGFSGSLKGKFGTGMMTTVLGTQPYMAPEILLEQPYKGDLVDIFAIGVILFMLVAGTPPFEQATSDDAYYRNIVDNKWDTFWKYHSQNKPNGIQFFSSRFKELMESLLNANPKKRMPVADIKNHPWYQGTVASASEVITECKKRYM